MNLRKQMEKIGASMQRIGRRNWVIIGAVALIGATVLLNFVLFGNAGKGGFDYDGGETVGSSDGAGETNASQNGDDGYFSSVEVSRRRARDEALEVLQSVVDNEKADDASKAEALLQISKLAEEMTMESEIETLVLAKGFLACVAVVNDGSASVVVKCEGGLIPSRIAQINEIVYEQTGILPENVNIIER